MCACYNTETCCPHSATFRQCQQEPLQTIQHFRNTTTTSSPTKCTYSRFLLLLLILLLLLLLLLLPSSSSLSPLCRVFTHICLTQTLSLTTQCYSHSAVATVYGAHITSSCVGCNVLLHQHFPQYVCSAQYGSFL
jgi:hypothetical protein